LICLLEISEILDLSSSKCYKRVEKRSTGFPLYWAEKPFDASVDQRQKGVVEVIASEDEDTCSGLIFKRKRKVDVAVPANSASDDYAPSFRKHPPSASSPRDLVVREGGRESTSGGNHDAPPADLPAFLQRALLSFQDRERMESMDEDPCKSRQPSVSGTSSLHLVLP